MLQALENISDVSVDEIRRAKVESPEGGADIQIQ
jgi:hypothetical protein